MKALIVTDIQNDFLPGGALGVKHGDQIIKKVNELQKTFPLVVATQDWHPADHQSFASTHPGKEVMEKIQLGHIEQILWPDHCVQGSHGAELAEELSVDRVEAIFRKGMDPEIDSYSVFYDNEHLKSTGLADYLKGRGVTDVFLVGLAGDFCVGFSALDALQEGFNTWLVEDATRPIDEAGFEKMKQRIRHGGGQIIHSDSI